MHSPTTIDVAINSDYKTALKHSPRSGNHLGTP